VTEDRIAIVGMACRVPGAAGVPALWRNLCAGVDSVRRLGAAQRPDLAGDPRYVPAFGFLDALTDFDAELFGYPPEEAALLDPQHRLFLEVAWWALEDAGYDPERSSAQTGVFAGCAANRYLRYHLLGNPALRPPGGRPEDWDAVLAGGACDYLPARAAYALGLSGPAVAVQTACSSSLVAVCQAGQSLLDFRCDLAVAGGAAVVSTGQVGHPYRPGGTLSADGYCRPYDAAATGQVFGNGAGAVVLKRLAEAVEDGDHVYAVLAGWAVNNDGAQRAGFTVPGLTGQAAVVAEALAAAGWDPATVGFVEGHGTGTPLGDALEIEALTRAFRTGTDRTGYCTLGSLKANLGNLDAAAGVLGLVKAALAVRHGEVPPTLHFARPHPEVDLLATPFVVGAPARPWTGPRRAAVSSFGLGGTNAHALVEEAPDRPAGPGRPGWTVLALSANDPAALRSLRQRLATFLTEEPQTALADVGYTLAAGRRRLGHRAAVVARDTAHAVEVLNGPSTVSPDAPDELRRAAHAWLADGTVPPGAGRRIPLPGYPFQRRRHWHEPVRGRL
jgi:3-oxoacyl-[acyl-carrier-protein] synthase II